MSTAELLIGWYFFCGLYTYAMTTTWPRDIRCMRAAVLWPVFWGVIVFRHLVKP